MTSITIYLLMQADNLKETISLLFGISIVILFGVLIASVSTDTSLEEQKTIAKFRKWVIAVFTSLFVLDTVIPSSKTIAAMYAVPAVVNNEQVQQLPEEILMFVRDFLKEHTKEHKKD
jgi:hypothetical protein